MIRQIIPIVISLVLCFGATRAETMEGIGEIVAHNAILPIPVGSDSVAFLRVDQNIPGKPMELFLLDLTNGEESRLLPGFDFRELPSFTYAFSPAADYVYVPRLLSGQWELMRYKLGSRQGEVLTELRDLREEFPADLTEQLKTRSDLLVYISDLAVSPSGKKAIFNVSLPNRVAIWTVDLETKQLRQVTPDNVGYYGQVDQDDNLIYYTVNATREGVAFDQDIVRRSVLTGEIDTLVSAGADEFGAVISPDGKYIAYGQRKNDITDIWVKNLATGEHKKLTNSPGKGHCNFPRWSGDGNWVYYQVAGIENPPMTARTKHVEF